MTKSCHDLGSLRTSSGAKNWNNSNIIIDVSQVHTVQYTRKDDKPTTVVSDTSNYGSLNRDSSQYEHNVAKISSRNLNLNIIKILKLLESQGLIFCL